jgi:GTP-binding protein
VKAFLNKLKESWEFLPANFVTSTVKKMGRDKILTCIDEMNMQFRAIA